MQILKKMLKSKRGDDMIIDFWAIAIFAVILLLFFLLFSITKTINDSKVQKEYVNKDVNIMLTSFLRAPAINVDSTKTIGEIITEDSAMDDFTRSEKLFLAYFSQVDELNGFKINSIVLSVKGSHDKELGMSKNGKFWSYVEMIGQKISAHGGQVDKYVAETYIPGYESKTYVSLTLRQVVLSSDLNAADDAKDKQTNN
jgi:hypothetical protein